jgi:hypothetical protein
MEDKVSIIIPSKTEKFLEPTIRDVLKNAEGDIEIFPVLDGYDVPKEEFVDDPRVHYLKLEPSTYTQKRHGVNLAVSKATGKYVMSLDAHCLVAKGFDKVLKEHHQSNWVQIPRRHRLDAEKWDLQIQCDSRPPIDYEYIIFHSLIKDRSIHGFKWDARTLERKDILIDDTIEFQGSCWFMTKDWFVKNGFMQVEGYRGWGQEAEEIGFTTWKNGGEVKTNKHTYYAHLHKGHKYGRMYYMSRDESRKSYAYSFNKWLIENKDFFIWLIGKFEPLPMWPKDWRDRLWKL